MASSADYLGLGRTNAASKTAMCSRQRIIEAAAEVLRIEPESFSVQRVARVAGFSARAIYGHFESGAELAHAARIHNLKSIIEKLPSHVNGSIEPPLALRQFAFHIAEALRQQGSASLLLSRQDDAVRGEYRRLLRAPLVREVDSYLRHRQPGTQVADYDRARLAELIITVIESIVVNFDSDIALNLDCNEMLNRSIEAMCAAFGIQGTQSSC